MSTATLTTEELAASIVAGIANRPRRDDVRANFLGHNLAQIFPFAQPVPTVQLCPVTRAIGPTGRIRLALGGRTLEKMMDWTAGPLSVELRGSWVILRPSTIAYRHKEV